VVEIQRLNGGGPTRTDITNINTRALKNDSHTTNSKLNFLLLPKYGTTQEFSHWISVQLNVISGLTGTINNIKWFTEFTPLNIGIVGETAVGYTQSNDNPELTVANYPTLAAEPTSVSAHTRVLPKTVVGSETNPFTGPLGDSFVYQFQIDKKSDFGTIVPMQVVWAYDES